ncbi:hypothetical protein [Nocardioides houyundeii]|uniref:hypothetical protein n=1 Tax=Nocardioides houyundeii TaxID=2045452 RepID=UPI0013157124|nr:hypothetical protein [Nocardioides houyundeii]
MTTGDLLKRVWLVLIPFAALSALVAAVPALGAAPAGPAAATTCLGKPVTIVAGATVFRGTEGDDVVAMTPGGWGSFDALGGNDTICLAQIQRVPGDGEARGRVDAGSGDDVVVNPPGTGAYSLDVGLGAGSDTFTGNSETRERVYAETATDDYDGHTDPPPPGDQRDVIDMGGGPYQPTYEPEWYADAVWSIAPPGAANADRITFGPGGSFLYYTGTMAPGGSIDVSAATQATLQLPKPGAAEPAARGDFLVDNVARRAEVGGVQVLAWQGHIDTFNFGDKGEDDWKVPVSFLGSDARESLRFDYGTYGDVRLGGGDDYLETSEYEPSRGLTFRSADGGPGRDTVALINRCATLTIRLADTLTCEGTSVPFTGFESVYATTRVADGRVKVVGTAADDDIEVRANQVTVDAGAGDDGVWPRGRKVRVNAGPGADHVDAQAQDLVVRGQAGPDRISLAYPYDAVPGEIPRVRRWVALGGPGRDVLKGTRQKRQVGDRLIGGPGRDRADGDAGTRDYCDAEVTRRCERGPARRR